MDKIIIPNYEISVGALTYNLEFKDNLTLIMGDSGIGKTLLYNALADKASERANKEYDLFECFNYRTHNILEKLKLLKNKVIIIDNAEAVLDLTSKLYITRDRNNQYIIFAHYKKGFYANGINLATMEIEEDAIRLEYKCL